MYCEIFVRDRAYMIAVTSNFRRPPRQFSRAEVTGSKYVRQLIHPVLSRSSLQLAVPSTCYKTRPL